MISLDITWIVTYCAVMITIFVHSRVVIMAIYMLRYGSVFNTRREKIDTVIAGAVCTAFILLQVDSVSAGSWPALGFIREMFWCTLDTAIGVSYLRILTTRHRFYVAVEKAIVNAKIC